MKKERVKLRKKQPSTTAGADLADNASVPFFFTSITEHTGGQFCLQNRISKRSSTI
jgi:hypothetical protein